MEDLDRKFTFTATKTKDGVEVTQKEGVVFLAKDNALLPTLNFYKDECERQGASEEQITGIRLLFERVVRWRTINMSKCKIPDVSLEEAEHICKSNQKICVELPEEK